MNRLAHLRRAIFGEPAPVRRHYEAAGASGRWPITSHVGANASHAHAAAPVAGARASWLAANSPHAAAIVNSTVINVVADGPSFRPTQGDGALVT